MQSEGCQRTGALFLARIQNAMVVYCTYILTKQVQHTHTHTHTHTQTHTIIMISDLSTDLETHLHYEQPEKLHVLTPHRQQHLE